MKRSSASSLISYLFPPIDNVVKAIFIIIVGIIVTVIQRNPWILAVFVLLTIIEVLPDIAKASRFFSSVNYYKSRSAFDSLLSDFANGTVAMNGKVVIGEKYIFGKKCGAVIAYADIVRAHQFVRKNYGYSCVRFVEIFTLDGNKHKLCKLGSDDETYADAKQLMMKLKELCPSADIIIE